VVRIILPSEDDSILISVSAACLPQATVIIKKAESTQCPGRFPQASPAHGGNQVFIYQADVRFDASRAYIMGASSRVHHG